MKFRFELGEVLKDKVTGFSGVVMVRAEYFTGCIHYGLCPQTLKEGKSIDWEWIDESLLVKVEKAKKIAFAEKEKVVEEEKKKTRGGSFPTPKRM